MDLSLPFFPLDYSGGTFSPRTGRDVVKVYLFSGPSLFRTQFYLELVCRVIRPPLHWYERRNVSTSWTPGGIKIPVIRSLILFSGSGRLRCILPNPSWKGKRKFLGEEPSFVTGQESCFFDTYYCVNSFLVDPTNSESVSISCVQMSVLPFSTYYTWVSLFDIKTFFVKFYMP